MNAVYMTTKCQQLKSIFIKTVFFLNTKKINKQTKIVIETIMSTVKAVSF